MATRPPARDGGRTLGPNRIERVIAAIRASNAHAIPLYTEGQCYGFHLLLREIFGPTVEPWYSPTEGHVYSKIGPHWYDIRGRHLRVDAEPLREPRPDPWGRRDTRRLVSPRWSE